MTEKEPNGKVTKLFACPLGHTESNVTRLINFPRPILIRRAFLANAARKSGCGAQRQPHLNMPTNSVLARQNTAFTHLSAALSPFTTVSHESARVDRATSSVTRPAPYVCNNYKLLFQ